MVFPFALEDLDCLGQPKDTLTQTHERAHTHKVVVPRVLLLLLLTLTLFFIPLALTTQLARPILSAKHMVSTFHVHRSFCSFLNRAACCCQKKPQADASPPLCRVWLHQGLQGRCAKGKECGSYHYEIKARGGRITAPGLPVIRYHKCTIKRADKR